MKKIFRTKEQWRAIVLACPGSGLSILQYCKNQNICLTNFYAWRKRLGLTVNSKIGFVRLNQPALPSRGINIETPNGYKIEVNGFDELTLQKILGMVKVI